MEHTPHPGPLPQGERGAKRQDSEHRGWSWKMIIWSVALAAFLLLAAWGAANWRPLHLACCRRMLASDSNWWQETGTRGIVRRHLRPGMTVEEARDMFRPVQLVGPVVAPSPAGETNTYLIVVGPVGDADGYLGFDKNGKLMEWQTVP
jgi:hypothetical protein